MERGSMTDQINLAALEPLYAPWEEPNQHRARAEQTDGPALIQKGRRPSSIAIANNLRHALSEWRAADYVGASDTTRELFTHWFLRDHQIRNGEQELVDFHYYFCQREALEAFVYLSEVLNTLESIYISNGVGAFFTALRAKESCKAFSPPAQCGWRGVERLSYLSGCEHG